MLKRSVLVAVAAAGSVLLHPSAPANAVDDCTTDCAVITVGDGEVEVPVSDGTGSVVVSFTQAPTMAPTGEGPDDIAAVAFSIGLPGDGAGNPLVFDCDGGQLASGAVEPSAAIRDDFTVVVENESCNARQRCLCPGDGQDRDDFVNIVVYGPKDLPSGGPVEIPRLPDDGDLLTMRLRAGEGVQEGDTVDLHIFCEQDEGVPARPQFAADLSIGDQAAIDQTVDRDAGDDGVSRIQCNSGTVRIVPGGATCVGDCDGNGVVAVNELIRGVNINLENADLSTCPAMDANGDGSVAINELIQAVNNNLNGCPS